MPFYIRRMSATAGTALLALYDPIAALAQADAPLAAGSSTALPAVEIVAPRRTAPVRRPRPHVVVHRGTSGPPPTAAHAVAEKTAKLDDARRAIVAPLGASPYDINHQAIQALPQGTDAPLDKVLLQAPGVSQDSAAGGELHVRNEHGNLQYRINGIMLPDGVGGFGQIFDTRLVGNLALITGALPAQYGFRTAGVIDIQTNPDAFNNSGSVSVYGGSHSTMTPSVEYGGTIGQTQYFVSGRYFGSTLGLENPTPAYDAIHDRTSQEKGFVYLSTVLDPTSRLTFMSGVANGQYQIPNNPGQIPMYPAVSNLDSSQLNENQHEFNQFNVLAYQKSADGFDYQLSFVNRTSILHFTPDVIGDLTFNGVASDVYRQSVSNGIQEDTSYRLSDAHTLRFGFSANAENGLVNNTSTLLPAGGAGAPYSVFDSSAKTGLLLSTYLQDEWKITNQWTLNAGLRFDQMYQYVDANQLSPRVSLTYQPFTSTTIHVGYARNFTPPSLVLAAPVNLALVQNSTQQPAVPVNDPVLPERSHVFDAGIVQKVLPGLELGADVYYKTARDLLDDGQFGAAYVLTAFNYDRAQNVGVEVKGNYTTGDLRLYGNVAWGYQKGTTIVSNQFLFDPAELAYIARNYVYTDHSQTWTASAGGSYLWNGTRFSASMIYGSGLRADFANTGTVSPYTQINLGLSHDFFVVSPTKPTTLRFDIVNVFDSIYEIRDGSGIGVFAPQYGARRGFFFGLSQKI